MYPVPLWPVPWRFIDFRNRWRYTREKPRKIPRESWRRKYRRITRSVVRFYIWQKRRREWFGWDIDSYTLFHGLAWICPKTLNLYTGVVTYSTNLNTSALLHLMSISSSSRLRILLETDAPYMVPSNIYPALTAVDASFKGRLPLCHTAMIPWTAELSDVICGEWDISSAIHALSLTWISRAFSRSGLIFSGVIASLNSELECGSTIDCGGAERTESVVKPRRLWGALSAQWGPLLSFSQCLRPTVIVSTPVYIWQTRSVTEWGGLWIRQRWMISKSPDLFWVWGDDRWAFAWLGVQEKTNDRSCR